MTRVAVALLLSFLAAIPAAAGPPLPATEEEVKALLATAGEANDLRGAATVVVLDEADVFVQETGLARTEARTVVKALTDDGGKSLAIQRLSFDPAVNRAAFVAVAIRRKDGRIEEVPLSRAVAQPSPQDAIYWGGTTVSLPVPRLSAGDALDIRTTRIGYNIAYLAGDALSGDGLTPPMEGHWFEVARFYSPVPVLRKRYSVHVPAAMKLQHEIFGGGLLFSLWREGDTEVHTFAARDLPAVSGEPSMVSFDDCAPKVVLSTVPDWPAKSRWFEAANHDQFEADDAVRAKVAELTAGLPDEEAKIAALLHWVADGIRYCGTSRGPREGYTLHRGEEIYRERAGVCKDMAGMLITMLRAAGFDAWPALTMAGSRVETIPADQFNHTVVALRGKDGSFRFLDPTWSPASRELWSSREALQGVVPGTPEGTGLLLTPHFPPEYNGLAVSAESRIDAAGGLGTTLRMSLSGYPCTYFRRNVNRRPPRERETAFAEALAIAPGARITSLSHIDPFDYSRDAWAQIGVAAAGFLTAGPVRAFRLPLLSNPLGAWLMPDLLSPPPEGERKYPLRLRATRLVHYSETIELPAGWTVVEKPADRAVDEKAASLSFSTKVEGNRLTYSFTLAAKMQTVPAEDVAGLRKALLAAKELAESWVAVRAGEEKR